MKFSRRARVRPRSIFKDDMLDSQGEGLFGGRMKRFDSDLYGKTYYFTVRNDDGRQHFTRLSRQFESLRFVLTYDDSGSGEIGSYLIHRGRSKAYLIPEQQMDSVMSRHEVDFDADWEADDGENWTRFVESRWELMDSAEQRWMRSVLKIRT